MYTAVIVMGGKLHPLHTTTTTGHTTSKKNSYLSYPIPEVIPKVVAGQCVQLSVPQ